MSADEVLRLGWIPLWIVIYAAAITACNRLAPIHPEEVEPHPPRQVARLENPNNKES